MGRSNCWLIAALLALMPGLAESAQIVFCDPDDPLVADRVTYAILSADTEQYETSDLDLSVVNPILTGVSTLPWYFWKCDGTTTLIPMTSQEQNFFWNKVQQEKAQDGELGVCWPGRDHSVIVLQKTDAQGGDVMAVCYRHYSDGDEDWARGQVGGRISE